MKRFFAIMAMIIGLGLANGCVTSQDEARRTLEKHGFTNIETGDWIFFGCGEGDKKGRDFVAIDEDGHRVFGIVCCATWWNSCIIR